MFNALSVSEGLWRTLRRKDLLVFLAVLLLSLLFSRNIFQGQQKKLRQIKEDINLEEERVRLAKELVDLNAQIIKISSPYLVITNLLTIEKLNALASGARVKIVSITPEPEYEGVFYKSTPFRLMLKANSYQLGRFINILESQPGLIKIEGLSARASQAAAGAKEENNLEISMTVSTTLIKLE